MEPRRVTLLVGRKSYNLKTSLDDDKLRDVYEVLHDVVALTDPAMDQDERLFLAGITMANELLSIRDRMKKIEDALNDLPPRTGPPAE